jgi:hypothetical protein
MGMVYMRFGFLIYPEQCIVRLAFLPRVYKTEAQVKHPLMD